MKASVETNIETDPQVEEAGPLYARIHRVLSGRIARGIYPLHTLIPTEVELAGEFETSRSTIREALRCLTEDGLVERRQGMGTRVIAARAHSGYQQSFSSLQELFQVALDTFMVLLGRDDLVLDEELALQIGGNPGERWIRVYGVRWSAPGGKPLCYIESYVPERLGRFVPEFVDLQGPFFDLLERRSQETIREVQQEIRSVIMPVGHSRMLGLADGALALQLLRRYVTDAGVMITSVNWHPAAQMTYRMQIRRTPAGRNGAD
ncbi:MAG: GntR family transcriptional regulator [Mesorhizobium sp.]